MDKHPCSRCDFWEGSCTYERMMGCKLPCPSGALCDFNPIQPIRNNLPYSYEEVKPKVRKKNVSLDKEKAMELYKLGWSDKEISNGCNVAAATAQHWRNRMGLPVNDRKKTGLEQRMRALYDAGLTDRKIGEIVGKQRKTIASWRERRGLPSKWAKGHKKTAPRAGTSESGACGQMATTNTPSL